MTTISRKSKMVSFRVAPHEYDRLRKACTAHGVANVSELARTAMDRVIAEDAASQASFDRQLRDLKDRVQILSAEIDRLSQHAQAQAGEAPAVHDSVFAAAAAEYP